MRFCTSGGRKRLVQMLSTATVITIMAAAPAVSSAAFTSFSYTATPTSWVGLGLTSFSATPPAWLFTVYASTDRTYVRLDTDKAVPGFPGDFELELKAPTGQTLVPGFYPGAMRYPFQNPGSPGMWLSGNGRGDNQITGYFTILEAVYGPGNTITSFAVDFRQYDEGVSTNYVDGKWRFNSAIPEPASLCLLSAGALLVFGRRPRRS